MVMGDTCFDKEEEMQDTIMRKRRMHGRGGARQLSCNKSDNKGDEVGTVLRKCIVET